MRWYETKALFTYGTGTVRRQCVRLSLPNLSTDNHILKNQRTNFYAN